MAIDGLRHSNSWAILFDTGDGLGWRIWARGYVKREYAEIELPEARAHAKKHAEPNRIARVALEFTLTTIESVEMVSP